MGYVFSGVRGAGRVILGAQRATMILNPKRLKIVLVAAAIFIGMGLFPPWTYTLGSQSLHRERPAGYSLIFFPPPPEVAAPAYGVRLDVARLGLQWILLLVAAGAMLASSRVSVARSPDSAIKTELPPVAPTPRPGPPGSNARPAIETAQPQETAVKPHLSLRDNREMTAATREAAEASLKRLPPKP